jgi:sulfatase maturation enzyme AslB (radical SAM superfamily)
MYDDRLLYAVITNHCNLSCPHCYGRSLQSLPETFNRDRFHKVVNEFEGIINLFGGEPTLYQERLFDLIESNRTHGKSQICAISTNLIILNDPLLKFYREKIGENNLGISTSWNLKRFSEAQYAVWLEHCKVLSENAIPYAILITLTEDLIAFDMDALIDLISKWPHKTLEWIRFELCISADTTPAYFKQADQWLCRLYEEWKLPIKVDTFRQVKNWQFDCREKKSVFPDGTLINSCIHGLGLKKKVPPECLNCAKADTCIPCCFQEHCSQPKELARLIELKEGERNES